MPNYIILPEKIKFYDWAAGLMYAAPGLNLIIPPQKEEDWRGWAYYATYLNQTQYPLLPIPDNHLFPRNDSWRDWGALFTYLVA